MVTVDISHRRVGRIRSIAIALCVMLVGNSELAIAEQVGTAVVNGKTVILDSDGTWKYRDGIQPSSLCDKLEGFEVCVRKIGWTALQKHGQFAYSYTYNQRYYFGIIVNPFGTTRLKRGCTSISHSFECGNG